MTAFVKTYPYSVAHGRAVGGYEISRKEGELLVKTYQKVPLSDQDLTPAIIDVPTIAIPAEVWDIFNNANKVSDSIGVFDSLRCRGFDSKHPNGLNPCDQSHMSYSDGAVEGVLLGIIYGPEGVLDERWFVLAWWGQTQKAAEQTPQSIWHRHEFTHNVGAGSATHHARRKLLYAGFCWLALFLSLVMFRQDLLPLLMTSTVMGTLLSGFFIPSIRNVWKDAFETGEKQIRRNFFFKDYPSPEEIRFDRKQ